MRPNASFYNPSQESVHGKGAGIQSGGSVDQCNKAGDGYSGFQAPQVSLPKGGGAIRGIGEKFAANPVTGTGSMSVPIAISPGRAGFGPQLTLSYDSGAGNGLFGFGWSLSLPQITRKTDKGLPQYNDGEESDVFLLSGSEDLVPLRNSDGSRHEDTATAPGYTIHRYFPRIEGLFARIERWTDLATGQIHWRSITHDNITTLYGKSFNSCIVDPNDPMRIFSWLICESYDDKGNAMVYEYESENEQNIDLSQANERNRERTANRYLKRIKYGNQTPNRDGNWNPTEAGLLPDEEWMFIVVFDYNEEHYEELRLDPAFSQAEQHQFVRATAFSGPSAWRVRPDPFSFYRSGFEVRTYRRCRRVLMFHNFKELGEEPYLVRSTEFDYVDLDYSQISTNEAELAHPGSTRYASFIKTIIQSGFVRDDTKAELSHNGLKYFTYLKKSLPPLEFDYSKAKIQEDIRELDTKSLENLPVGLDGITYQWVDLDGEGLSGILTEQADAWFYKPNVGNGSFGPLEVVNLKPSLANLSSGQQQLLDLAGNGHLDVVALSGSNPGYFERTNDKRWELFREFTHLPNISWDDPNLRFVDLNGDGYADILITEHEVLTWHPSLAERGFGAANQVSKQSDEERGPNLVLADGTQSVYLADMCGDGLMDLVRIRNGEVCYWPNLGYGHFGAKVTMDGAPMFDHSDQFNQQRIRLADIDGSGLTDIIYLGRHTVRLYFNRSGNSWSEPFHLSQVPVVDNLSSVIIADLLGNGTACLVWSSLLPNHSPKPLHYIDLMGGQKPNLLIKSTNNLGAETQVHYAPSTKFYIEDKKIGKPWITKLPFPVHVVEWVQTYDHISGNRFVNHYAYHHGYFDGFEREFRGFGMVEQWDTEEFKALTADQDLPVATNLDNLSHVPPVYTKTWFHTGIHIGRDNVSDYFAGLRNDREAGEYYREPGLSNAEARQLLLEDTVLPAGLSVEVEREACRALKGMMLRQEVYALDKTTKEKHPYIVTEQNFTIRCLQAKGRNQHAVFFTHPREVISYHYERNPSDPRVTHALTLEADDFGNVLKSAAVSYGRRQPDSGLEARDQVKQGQLLITYTENDFTNHIHAANDYRSPLPCESQTYEVTGLVLQPNTRRFTFQELMDGMGTAVSIHYEESAISGVLQKRLIEHSRTRFRRNNLIEPLQPGELESLALPFESYRLAFSPGLVTKVFGERVSNDMLANEGRYVHSEGDANWWIPSGQMFYSPDATDNSAQELVYARKHFFLPHRYRDPFHSSRGSTETTVTYDAYNLLVQETRDALDNYITVGERDIDPTKPLASMGHNYRVLQSTSIMDFNRNCSIVAYDALGMVVGTAVMGKPEHNPRQGDSLNNFDPNLTEAVVITHLQNPLNNPQIILQQATTRLVYDLFAYYRTKNQLAPQPSVVYALVRETHDAELVIGQKTNIQHSFTYSDGFGQEIQRKIQAEPGPVPKRDPTTRRIVVVNNQPEMVSNDGKPRWVGSGWTVYNNKGKPVRQYEPFFTDNHQYEFDVRIGVSSVLFYDPVERVVVTLHPNNTYQKVIFDAWKQATWDMNDTVKLDPRTDTDVSGYVAEYFKQTATQPHTWKTWLEQRGVDPAAPPPDTPVLAPEKKAAIHTLPHADTPAVNFIDSLGRSYLSFAHNGFKPDGAPIYFATRINLDIEGNQREITDAKDRIVMRYDYDMLGNRVYQASMEAGKRWMLNDVSGKLIRAWDSRGHQFRTEYDSLGRLLRSYVTGADTANHNRELLVERLVYGEQHPEDLLGNLRGKVYLQLDLAGVASNEAYDFKGNIAMASRRLAQEYKKALDWNAVNLVLPANPTVKFINSTLQAALEKLVESETFSNGTIYDALNRPIQIIAPHSDQAGTKLSIIQPTYNEASLLERVDVWLDRPNIPDSILEVNLIPPSPVGVSRIDYDAKGQRLQIRYKNHVTTRYTYDPETFRLTHLYTGRGLAFTKDCGTDPQPKFAAPKVPPKNMQCGLQNLYYTYDPVGNITYIRDDAQQRVFFDGKVVEPSAEYKYDAIYRLIQATGREHLGQVGGNPIPHSHDDAQRTRLPHPNDGNAIGRYCEKYLYDEVGNLLEMSHHRTCSDNASWRRAYFYEEASQIEQTKKSNRLSHTTVGTNNPTTESYLHDEHGNIIRMPHLGNHRNQQEANMHWDYRDQLRQTDLGGGGTAYYVYDSGGQRVRKVWEKSTTLIEERIYLGGFEIFRLRNSGAVISLQRETLHIMDDKQRIALVEKCILDTAGNDPAPRQLIRYQLGNHLGSVSLELNEKAEIISYEEYTPYGSTSYQAVRNQTETPKRFRYTNKERDEESGFYYHGLRYYAAWVGKWISCDPLGISDGLNVYQYSLGNPIRFFDPTGTSGEDPSKSLEDDHMAIRQKVYHHFRSDLIAAEKDIPYDPKKYKGKDGFFRWRRDIGIEAHKRTQSWVKQQWSDAVTESLMKSEGTRPDIAFPKRKLMIELKSTMTGLMDSPEQQARQIAAAAKRGWAYTAITARESLPAGGLSAKGDSYYVSRSDVKKAAGGNKSGRNRGFASTGSMALSAVGSGLAILGGLSDMVDWLEFPEQIDDIKANKVDPIIVQRALSKSRIEALITKSSQDLQIIKNGELSTNMLIDPQSGNIYMVILENNDKYKTGDIVGVGTSRNLYGSKVFKDNRTGDVYFNSPSGEGWQVTGPTTGATWKLFPGQ
ncbi:SpvB/TcaC N-terminal domain-containing protein [Sabulibacter ruber]|uniref:SpvB/TcaC N-terminal domain-containing protein n=1 Tax=Sabulibacter ruber TaxID=2811901 RepID=UPI001A9652EA|nr:SpvB/TcaC N-terminal domain-containing protein [Sabulibacter ruber]